MSETPNVGNAKLVDDLVLLIDSAKRVVLLHDNGLFETTPGDSQSIENLRLAIGRIEPEILSISAAKPDQKGEFSG